MKPRQPYRSPFWRPDIVSEPVVAVRQRPNVEDRRVAPEPQPPSSTRQPRPVSEQTVGYAQSDLALFGRLMDFGRSGPEPTQPRTARPVQAVKPEVPGRVAGDHTSGDLALFRTLQAPFASLRQDHAAPTGARPGPEAATHDYAQSDLDAFERLARFGRST